MKNPLQEEIEVLRSFIFQREKEIEHLRRKAIELEELEKENSELVSQIETLQEDQSKDLYESCLESIWDFCNCCSLKGIKCEVCFLTSWKERYLQNKFPTNP